MSKKCPYCGSYNTEVSVSNYATRAVINTGRFVIATGASIIASAFSPSAGHAAGHTVMHNTDPGEFKGHHCCNCGKDFSA